MECITPTVFPGAPHGDPYRKPMPHADVLAFSSKTNNFGSGGFGERRAGRSLPVIGPRDVLGAAEVGVLSENLRLACLAALKISPQDCRQFAASQTWEMSARVFVNNISAVRAETGSRLQIAAKRPRLAT